MVIYEDLLFPQVPDLPRDVPVYLPLGGCPEEHLKALGEGPGLLMPPIPYGFEPPLELTLEPFLQSLRGVLAEDGFSHLTILGPRSYLDLPHRLWHGPRLTLPRATTVVPIGHTEQHGFHLPLCTDSRIAEAIAERACQLDPALGRLPVWPYGVSTHRRQYPGTLSVDARAFEDLFVQLRGGLSGKPTFFLNGHGGNHSFLVNVCKFAGETYPDRISATTFLHTASGEAALLLSQLRESSLMGHACELETSYLLHLRPELVQLQWGVEEEDFVSTPNYRMDWIEDGCLILNPPWSDDTRTGSYGSPLQASAEKGRRWLEAAAAEVVSLMHELEVQEQRRQQRRQQGWVEGAWRELWASRRRNQNNANEDQQ